MKKIYSLVLSVFLLLAAGNPLKAQTTLVAGDLVFTGFNCDLTPGDNFSFVLLKNISATTQIRFTDFGWVSSSGVFGSGVSQESELVFVAGSAITAGTEIVILGNASPTATFSGGASAGTVTFTTGTLAGVTAATVLSLSTTGDQIFAYQGSFASPQFIAGVHFNTYTIDGGDGINTTDASWDGTLGINTPNGTNSAKPAALTAGTNAVWLGVVSASSPFSVETDNAIFNCSGTLNTPAGVQAAVCTRANWTLSDVTTYTLPSGCTFLATPAPSFTGQPSASTACAGLSASFSVVASGSSISFSWQEATNAAFTTGVTTLATGGIYSISSSATTSSLTISDNSTVNGRYYRCTATNVGGAVNSNIVGLTATPNLLPTGNTSVTQASGTGNNSFYFASSCRIIAKLLPSGASPVSGTATSEVWVESSVPTVGSIPFVARHYQITPGAGTTGMVTLYFTQQEFTDFNNAPGSLLDLPTGTADAAGKANLRIAKYAGTSNNGSGLPGSYTGARTIIDPVDANIVWDATNSRWAVTFDVTDGFSGFIAQSSSVVLPVTLESFTGQLKSNKTVLLQWSFADQQDGAFYTVERSTDRISYNVVGTLAAGNMAAYSFIDNLPVTGKNYYRLKMTELSGRISYSAIVMVTVQSGNSVAVYPNPVKDQLTIQQIGTIKNNIILLTDLQGRVLQTIQLNSAQQTIDMTKYAAGMYLLKQEDGTTQKIIKE